MWAYQFADALHTSEHLDLERFVSMQNHYNLAYREEEREMLPLCSSEGIGVIPWSPLAQGYLARPHEELTATIRGEELADRHEWYRSGGGTEINARVEELAEEYGVTMARLHSRGYSIRRLWTRRSSALAVSSISKTPSKRSKYRSRNSISRI